MAFPITIEAILSKFTRIVVVQTIDTFVEEVYILEHQLGMDNYLINKNKFVIDNAARENDINTVLLETVLRLEIFTEVESIIESWKELFVNLFLKLL